MSWGVRLFFCAAALAALLSAQLRYGPQTVVAWVWPAASDAIEGLLRLGMIARNAHRYAIIRSTYHDQTFHGAAQVTTEGLVYTPSPSFAGNASFRSSVRRSAPAYPAKLHSNC